MVCGPEAARQVLVTQAHMFKPTYPPSKERVIGPNAIFFHQGAYHLNLRKLVQSSLMPSAIRGSVPRIEQIVQGFLPVWQDRTINTLQEMKMARALLNDILTEVIQNRRRLQSNGGEVKGLLAVLLENRPKMDLRLADSQVVDNVVGIIFAAHDTTASALTWVLKYLHDNCNVLEAVTVRSSDVHHINNLFVKIVSCDPWIPLYYTRFHDASHWYDLRRILQEEQEGVKRRLMEENRGLSWDDTRRMPVTSRVIQETLRVASILSFTYRESVQDVELKGFLIPKGWKVLPLFRSIHHCEDFFPQPEKFDPSRFEVAPKPNTYMPFGNGMHSCPGSELAKLEILILLHHLTLTYRWEVVGDGEGIQYGPFPVPKRGLPIKVKPKHMEAN
ncbi:hypothetical protein MLD38_009656 [Melastoma candidum]|uniref:Uncharacterized protein n=1 Tax=Melastoma candidum TaxID=119954 RepID=A0ACB9S054_9MYRT|nr:hypothetical protein MLD38_009656 [Melastoma candidum]